MNKFITRFSLLAIVSLMISFASHAQTAVEAELSKKDVFFINGYQLDNNMTLIRLQSKLGEASEIIEKMAGENVHKYEDLGLTVMEINGEVKGFVFNFNWDGDKNVPETTLVGDLKLMNVVIQADSNQDAVQTIDGVSVDCPMPRVCMLGSKKDKLMKMITFTKDGKVSQIVIALKK